MFKNLLKKNISWTIWFDPYCLFKDLMYINVFLTLVHFLVLKTYWKIVSHYGLTIIFLFKDSINFSLKVHAFFSVSKIFKEFESWTIWLDLDHPLRKHWSILSKALIGNSDQDKIWFESYCPSKDSTKVSIKSSFLLLEIFLKNFNQGQYGLIHIVHLVNFDQSLSTLHIVRSMLNFAMFLANSNQETIRTIRFDPYCLHKVFITFHQRLTLFPISNTFKKLKWRQKNLIHIVLNIIILFKRQHSLTSAIVSLKRILNIFNIET